MEQKDYLLREIEKIGLLLRKLINYLNGKQENLVTTSENIIGETSKQLLSEIGFDLMHFLTLDNPELIEYINKFSGVNAENRELLADLIFQIGLNGDFSTKIKCYEKSLQIYEYCNATDKTYSFEREEKIASIKKFLGE